MIAIDLFCGAGGLTRGLMNVGIPVVLGVDINEDYRKTYESNNAPAKYLCCDVRDVTGEQLLTYVPVGLRNEIALVGCAPCQPFSPHRKNSVRSEEALLLAEFARLVRELKPAWVFVENVPGIRKVPGFSTYRRFRKSLVELKYSFDEGILDAKSFGVPQTRRRFVMIASKGSTPTLPAGTHGPGRKPYSTVRSAIERFPKIDAGESLATVPNHKSAQISPLNLRRLKKTPKDGGGRLNWSPELQLECHKDYEGHSDVYGRMRWNAPAPTLTCRCFSISNGRYGHPEQHRAISLREAASLQSFPDSFVFFGPSQRSVGEQIGNAVPVLLAEGVGRHILASNRAARRKMAAGKQNRKQR